MPLRIKIAMTFLSAIVTTLGQSLLLHLLFPDLMAAYELSILTGLLLFNGAAAAVVLFSR